MKSRSGWSWKTARRKNKKRNIWKMKSLKWKGKLKTF